MTEKPHPPPTQFAIPSQNLIAPPPPVSQPGVPRKAETVEEEPYTIKCICNFSDDDGNTIYCDTCDTWQHIDCFYPESQEEALREDFSHSCADCKPRPLDIQKAVERTKRLNTVAIPEEAPDKKPKRPPSKGHKKKAKPSDLQLNGQFTGQENGKHGSPSEHQPPVKKVKASHRPSLSTGSQSNKRSPSHGNGRANGHPPSPATTPPDLPNEFEIHGYSDRFLSLYENEPEADPSKAPSNSFSSLATSNSVSLWPRDRQRLMQDTGLQFDDIFQKLPSDMSAQSRPLVIHEATIPSSGRLLRRKYLAAPTAIKKDTPLVELHGQIGFQKDYCADPESSWEELTSPLPFVFFHPVLPLCIDTRNEMSPARYVRRSCKPNAVLDTFLSEEYEYHFWLMSDRDIDQGEQITLPWDFRLPKSEKARIMHLIGLGDDETNDHEEPDMDEVEYQRHSGWLHRLLSEHGGCACDLGPNCAFARFHRHYHGKMAQRAQMTKKKSRKPKLHTISPTSTGHASNSRATSENRVDDADQDGRSASEQRSKPPSRDRTPNRQGSLDQPEILTGLTDREKRKVQMVEDSFRRMEQQPPPRKKKRVSDGTGTKSKMKSGTSTATNGSSRYVDAGTSRSKSGSPSSAHSTGGPNPFRAPASNDGLVVSGTPRSISRSSQSNYCDASVQTEPVTGVWYGETNTPKPRRRVISLSQRLLNNRHRVRCDEEQKRKRPASVDMQPSFSAPTEVDAPAQVHQASVSPNSVKEDKTRGSPTSASLPESGDTAMSDAPSVSPTLSKAPSLPLVKSESGAEQLKAPELRVQMPPVPVFGNATAAVPGMTTPQSACGSSLQSPLALSNMPSPFASSAINGIAQPSPVKKKLSLSDYTKSRANKKSGSGPKTPAGSDDMKAVLDVIADDPQKTDESAAQANGVSPESAKTTHTSL